MKMTPRSVNIMPKEEKGVLAVDLCCLDGMVFRLLPGKRWMNVSGAAMCE